MKRRFSALRRLAFDSVVLLALALLILFGSLTTLPTGPQLWDHGLFILASRVDGANTGVVEQLHLDPVPLFRA